MKQLKKLVKPSKKAASAIVTLYVNESGCGKPCGAGGCTNQSDCGKQCT